MNTPSSASNNYTSAIPSADNLASDGCINLSRLSSEGSLSTDDNNELFLGIPENQVDENVISPKPDSSQSANGTSIEDSKSLDEIIGVLKPDRVRWFYKNISNKQWIEFNGYDSLRIEKRYQQLPYECKYNNDNSSKNHDSSQTSNTTVDALKNNSDSVSTSPLDEFSPLVCDDVERVVVRGGMYEVDLSKRICVSIFWPGEETVITRGTWFYESNWQPVDVELSEPIEKIHLTQFLGKKPFEVIVDTSTPKKVLHTERVSDFSVVWYAPMEVYLYSQATPSKIVRSFTQRLGGYFHKKSGTRLLRGYKEVATDVDRPKDITHLVFVVHGIGQKMDIGGRILQNTALIRQNVTNFQNRFFPSSTQRAEFFPVEWRTSLTLDGGLVEAITPGNVTQLRNILNTSAMDIMYYTSPVYCVEIQRGLVTEINRLYSMFVERNPNHNVKVSVVAHSLGCVIVYDVITGYQPVVPATDDKTVEEAVPGKSRLNFHVDNLFLLGSPLAVFLALRFPRGQHGYHLFPPLLCNRLYNIFHISDPVAYRLEPLVVKDYSRIAPLPIWPYNAPHRIPYSEMPLELIEPQDVNKDKEPSSASTTANSTPKDESSGSPTETPVRERGWSIWGLMRGYKNQDGTASPQQMDSPTRGLEHRLDYVLKVSGSLGLSARTYLNVFSCHTAYWNNDDVAFFVLTRLFPELDDTVDTTAIVATEDKDQPAANSESQVSSS